MCNCKYECAYLAVIVSILSGVVLGVLYSIGLIATGLIFWVYLLIGALGILLAPIYGLRGDLGRDESCFCKYKNLITVGGIGTIVFAAVGLIVQFIASTIVVSIIIGLATFFIVFLLSSVLCLANCICED